MTTSPSSTAVPGSSGRAAGERPRASGITDAHRRFAVAPMMELTDRHYRHLARRLSRHTLLWTEMLTARAVVHGDRERLLGCDADDGPLVLQLGGSEPEVMAEAAAIGEAWGHDEINMNVGCPSDRVQAGRFGACLMAEPELVAENVRAMRDAVSIPVTVKCRLGIDRDDSYEALERFVRTVVDAGCEHVIVHARKAWLDGLSPKENRSIPPLRPEYVHRLKRALPGVHVTTNGGIADWRTVQTELEHVDGVMLGRHAYYHPAFLARADATVFAMLPDGRAPVDDIDALAAIARDYALYAQGWVEQGLKGSLVLRHLVALFQEVPGARQWRRHLSEHGPSTTDTVELVEEALIFVDGRASGGERDSVGRDSVGRDSGGRDSGGRDSGGRAADRNGQASPARRRSA